MAAGGPGGAGLRPRGDPAAHATARGRRHRRFSILLDSAPPPGRLARLRRGAGGQPAHDDPDGRADGGDGLPAHRFALDTDKAVRAMLDWIRSGKLPAESPR